MASYDLTVNMDLNAHGLQQLVNYVKIIVMQNFVIITFYSYLTMQILNISVSLLRHY